MAEQIKILIIEDEVILGEGLKTSLLRIGYHYVRLVKSPEEAFSALKEEVADLLIVDVNLEAEIDGIQLMEQVQQLYTLPFIFLTSYSNQELVNRAKVLRPSAYMLKPYNMAAIQIAIEMAFSNFMAETITPQLEADNNQDTEKVMAIKDAMFLKEGSHFEKVSFDQILWLEADNNYTEIHTANQTFVYSTVLKKIIPTLPTDKFYRVHRTYVVNKTSITGFEGHMICINEKKIPVSKQHRDEVFNWFQVL